MNAEWHRRHVMPKGASTAQRIAWHREHQETCACRPIPPGLREKMSRSRAEKQRDSPVDAYLATVSAAHRGPLRRLRRTIRAVVPEAEECISYGLPAFRLAGKVIGGFAATSKGCSYYPFSGTTLSTLADELAAYGKTKSAVHFGPDQPLPDALVRKLIEARVAETTARTKATQTTAKARTKAKARPKPGA